MVLNCGEELHDDVDLFLDEYFDDVVAEANDRIVFELEHFDGFVCAAVEMVEPQYLFGLVRHVAGLVVSYVAVQDCCLDVHQHVFSLGFDDLLVVGLQVFFERRAFEDILELLVQLDFLLNGTHAFVAL